MFVKNKTMRNVCITYLVSIVCFFIIRILASFGVLKFLGETGTLTVNMAIQIILMFSVPVFLFSAFQKQKVKTTFKFFGFKKISGKAVAIAIVMGLVVYILNIFVASFFDNILSLAGYKFAQVEQPTSYPVYMLFVNLFVTAVLPGICEETAHRGLLLKGTSGLGQKNAIIISALLFGLMHMNIEQFFYATIIGLFVGYISLLCDSIIPAMIIHFMNNALGVFMGFSYFYKLPLSRVMSGLNSFMQNNFLLGLSFVLLLVALLGWFLFFLVRKLFMETTGKNIINLQEDLYKELAKNDYLNEIEMSKAELNGNKVEEQRTVNLEEMFVETNIKYGYMTELDHQLLEESGRGKTDKVVLALMITCFVLSAAATIFTFVRGLL